MIVSRLVHGLDLVPAHVSLSLGAPPAVGIASAAYPNVRMRQWEQPQPGHPAARPGQQVAAALALWLDHAPPPPPLAPQSLAPRPSPLPLELWQLRLHCGGPLPVSWGAVPP